MHVVDKRGGSQEVPSAASSVQSLTAALDLNAACKIVDDDYKAEANLKHVLVESTTSQTSTKNAVGTLQQPLFCSVVNLMESWSLFYRPVEYLLVSVCCALYSLFAASTTLYCLFRRIDQHTAPRCSIAYWNLVTFL